MKWNLSLGQVIRVTRVGLDALSIAQRTNTEIDYVYHSECLRTCHSAGISFDSVPIHPHLRAHPAFRPGSVYRKLFDYSL